MSIFYKFFFETSLLKSFRVNLHYFPFKIAVRFPILVARRVDLKQLEGKVVLESKPTTGMLRLGYPYLDLIATVYDITVWEVSGIIRIREGEVRIGRGSRICVKGECVFGRHFTMTGKSTIICNNQIVFGGNVIISWDVLLMDTDFHRIYDENQNVINADKPIVIGDSVWIGCRCTVLKGSIIPSYSVIAASSTIVGKLLNESCIYSTKRILKEKIRWEE